MLAVQSYTPQTNYTAFKGHLPEKVVQKALDNLMRDKTVFVIAHRLSTIYNADKIIVIDDGNIVETGTHEELLNIPEGRYRNLYNMQFKKQEEVLENI